MSRKNEGLSGLSNRDKELVALGAAIASNCVPCVEYHIPQARNVGLSDSELSEAVELADEVRRVPADKVLQTARALLEEQNRPRAKSKRGACGCPDGTMNSAERTAGGPGEPHMNDVRLDNRSPEEDNQTKEERCGDDAKPFADARGSRGAGAGSRHTTEQMGFDFSKMMEMMQQCCPDKMKNFSSMMSDSEKGCCAPNEENSSKDSA